LYQSANKLNAIKRKAKEKKLISVIVFRPERLDPVVSSLDIEKPQPKDIVNGLSQRERL
jgi:hypothetical protein